MVVEQKVQEVLVGSADVTALVPAAKIKLPGDWQSLGRPYIVHFPVASEGTYTHNEGLMELRAWPSYQVSCFGNTYSEVKAVAVAVREALGDYKGADGTVMFWRGERFIGYEADVKVHHIAVELEIWEAL